MPEQGTKGASSHFNLANILFILFKWKRTILYCSGSGLLAAAAVWLLYPSTYQSNAELLVRYVLDRRGVDDTGPDGATRKTNDTVINAEVAILQSWDLAMQAAESLGPARVLPDAKAPTVPQAAGAIASGLSVVSTHASNVILVSYANRRPEVATLVLNELVSRYFTKHLEVHRSAGAFDFVSQQADQVRARLGQTEDALKALKAKAGVLELKDSVTGLMNEAARMGEAVRSNEAELAEQWAKVKLLEGGVVKIAQSSNGSANANAGASPTSGGSPRASATPPPQAQPTSNDVTQYQSLVNQLGSLNQEKNNLLTKYTATNTLVKFAQAGIETLEKQKQDLEKKFPILPTMVAAQGQQADLATERAKLVVMEAKADTLNRQFQRVQERIKQLGDMGPQIAALERTKKLEEANYKYFQNSLEKARVDEALDPSKMPNISAVQRPSPPGLVTKTRNEIAAALAGAGLLCGLAVALVSEMFFKQPVNRRAELETELGIPVFLSIPDASPKRRLTWRRKQLSRNGDASTDGDGASIAPWDPSHFMRRFAAAIGDRLALYFELHGIAHKPKLVGVTGFDHGAGSSTLAASLAAALSETGDGKVLLVDANASNGEAHPFFEGRPAAALTAAIKPEATALPTAADNLYLATVNQPHAKMTQLGLKKFFALVPNLKASDFDYIIFDLPPVDQTSPTIGLASLMDKVFLVAEAGKTSRNIIKRGFRELVNARADVAVVLNKTRTYGSKLLAEA
jgi:polysaccharide biosynthesis transport protein